MGMSLMKVVILQKKKQNVTFIFTLARPSLNTMNTFREKKTVEFEESDAYFFCDRQPQKAPSLLENLQ